MNIRHSLLALVLSASAVGVQAAEPHHHHTPTTAFDKRVMLNLTPTERAMILEEMHLFLAGVRDITAALASQDMAVAAHSARKLGVVMAHEVPPSLRAKLSTEFRQLGSSVHREFDQIAMDAESLKDVSHSLSQLSSVLGKCMSCHASYQIGQPARHPKH